LLFKNILQNFLAGLLLLWAEPFRVGDEIKIDNYEGTVEEVQTRATVIKTYDERRRGLVFFTALALGLWRTSGRGLGSA